MSGSLPGNIDSWFYLTAFHTVQNYIEQFFTGAYLGTSMFPEQAVYPFGNYSWGQAFIFIVYQGMGFDDIWSYNLLFITSFSLNALAAWLFAGYWIRNPYLRLASGFAFASTNFMFGNLDNPDAVFLSLGIMGAYLLWRALEEERPYLIPWAGLIAALEVYFSSYGFLFGTILMGTTLIYWFRRAVGWPFIRSGLFGLAIFIVTILPYCRIYVFNGEILHAWNPAESLESVRAANLSWSNLASVLEFNLIYSCKAGADYNWLYKTKAAFTGILLPVLGLAGFVRARYRQWLIGNFAFFLLMALGLYWANGFRSPMYWVYEQFHIQQFFRISVRAYFICTLLLVLSAYSLMDFVLNRYPRQRLVRGGVVLACLLIVVENVPYRFEIFNSRALMAEVYALPDFAPGDCVLNLPSTYYSGHAPDQEHPCDPSMMDDYEFEFVREHLYMYHQSRHKANTVNGLTGFVPWSRMENQQLIQRIDQNSHLEQLISRNGITHVLLHKQWFNGCPSEPLTTWLNQQPKLKKVLETDSITLFKVLSI